MITNKELTDIVLAYRAGTISKGLLHECFGKIAEWVSQKSGLDFDAGIHGAASLCVEKVERFDEERGKAFNYFTTIIMCYLRQERAISRRRLK